MDSLRKEIRKQVNRMPKGRIFVSGDLKFDVSKTANVNVLLAEMVKKGEIKRIEKGAYYRFEMSEFGLGPKPVSQEEIVNYLSRKYNGYSSGYNIYNLMGLTEQVPSVITIAVPNPVRTFRLDNIRFDFMKSYKLDVKPSEVRFLRTLDAIRQMNHIPGRTGKDIYIELKDNVFCKYSDEDIKVLVKLAKLYPSVVKAVVYLILKDIGCNSLGADLIKTINPMTLNKQLKKYNYEFA